MPIGFYNDLLSVLGSAGATRQTTISNVTAVGTLDTEVVITGPADVFYLEFDVTATASGTRWDLRDVTATSEGDINVKYTFRPNQVGKFERDFTRPIHFDRGLAVVYSASGSGQTFYTQMLHSAATRNRGGGV